LVRSKSGGPLPVAVIGAGAAGLLAALSAARSGADVVLLESTDDGGRKILISGGGRCNVLPSAAAPERFVTDSSPNTLRKILRSWPLAEQRRFFERDLGVPLFLEEDTGKLFPESGRARDIRDALVAHVRESGARIWFGARVTAIEPHEGGWTVRVAGAPGVEAAAVVLATGGLSVPNTGSDGAGLTMARALGHKVNPTYPALTPLTASPHPHAALAGVSVRITLTGVRAKPPFRTTGSLLVTHRGWSGPAVLDASHLATRPGTEGRRGEISVDWICLGAAALEKALSPDRAPSGAGGTAGRTVRSRLTELGLPRRLAEALVEEAGVSTETSLAQLRRAERQALSRTLTEYRLPWTGHEGYKKAEVTGGGVALDQVDARTMESRRAPGLYLCGEMLDAFGPIGGHNFQWAWATGRAAGSAAGAAVASAASARHTRP
jgi:predicted Rossmann fold flavoprotein